MLKKIKNEKTFLITSIITIIISLVITQFPLINGFTYEFAFIINIILLLLYPIAYKFNNSLNLYKSSFLLIIPIIIQLFTITNLCDPFKGILFYLFIPFTTLFLIHNLLKFLSLFPKNKSQWPLAHSISGKYYLIIFLALLSELYLLYSQPQIFFYNSFWGYFQGSLYDIDFSISQALMCLSAFKLINGAILKIIIYIHSSEKKIIIKEKTILAFLIIISALIYLNQDSLGLNSNHKYLQKTLGGHYKTKNFNIYYSTNNKITKKIKLIALEHEMRLAQLKKLYNIKWNTKIDSYIFDSSTQKKQLMGAGNTLIAKPWLGEIYINYNSNFPHSHLKHELSHIIAAKFSKRWLKIPMKYGILPQMGIVEGFAVSSEEEKTELTLFEQMAILKKINKFPKLEKMVSFEGFWSYNSHFAYKTVGGFLKFLRITYGVEKLKLLYEKESFKNVYNKDILSLKSEYLQFLSKIKIDEKYIPKTELRYSQKSVFKRVCPHDLQEIRINSEKLIKTKGFKIGIKKAEKLIKLEPFNINHKIYLSKLSLKYKKYNQALSYIKNLKSKLSSINRTILKLKADILWLNNFENKALNIYERLIIENISNSSYREIYIKIQALKDDKIEKMVYNYLLKRKSIGSYLYYFENINLDEKSFNIVNYLYGRYYFNYENYKEAKFYLNKVKNSMPYTFEVEILKMKIQLSFFLKNYENIIKYSYKLIEISKTEGVKEFAKNWIEIKSFFKDKNIDL